MIIDLPYGKKSLKAEIPLARIHSILRGKLEEYIPQMSQEALVEQALQNPIGSLSLELLAQGKNRVVILISDHTRPVPSKLLLPPMLAAIRRGNPQAQITLLVATGCHRNTSPDELREKVGETIFKNEKIVVHDCGDKENLIFLGTLPSGGDCIINKVAVQADLLISEGFIEPHFFAGFSGGRKSVLPGVASKTTVFANHCAEFINNPHARAGFLDENPIHRDMIFAARAANLAFIVNVVINAKHEVIGAFAGDCDAAHRAGANFLESLCTISSEATDIVVTTNNGYPLDQNIYQAVKGICTAEAICKPKGVIIMVAACEDGCGGEGFRRFFCNEPNPQVILDAISIVKASDTPADQWQAQIFARILTKFSVILVSEASPQLVRELHMYPAENFTEALEIADEILGHTNGSITVIPEGISIIVR